MRVPQHDPGFAAAQAGLAMALVRRPWYTSSPDESSRGEGGCDGCRPARGQARPALGVRSAPLFRRSHPHTATSGRCVHRSNRAEGPESVRRIRRRTSPQPGSLKNDWYVPAVIDGWSSEPAPRPRSVQAPADTSAILRLRFRTVPHRSHHRRSASMTRINRTRTLASVFCIVVGCGAAITPTSRPSRRGRSSSPVGSAACSTCSGARRPGRASSPRLR